MWFIPAVVGVLALSLIIICRADGRGTEGAFGGLLVLAGAALCLGIIYTGGCMDQNRRKAEREAVPTLTQPATGTGAPVTVPGPRQP